MTSYQYRKSHCEDKTILRPSYLHNGISYTGKTTSLYWICLYPSLPKWNPAKLWFRVYVFLRGLNIPNTKARYTKLTAGRQKIPMLHDQSLCRNSVRGDADIQSHPRLSPKYIYIYDQPNYFFNRLLMPKKIPHYWSFLKGIHLWLVDSSHKGKKMWKFFHVMIWKQDFSLSSRWKSM